MPRNWHDAYNTSPDTKFNIGDVMADIPTMNGSGSETGIIDDFLYDSKENIHGLILDVDGTHKYAIYYSSGKYWALMP